LTNSDEPFPTAIVIDGSNFTSLLCFEQPGWNDRTLEVPFPVAVVQFTPLPGAALVTGALGAN